MNTYMNVTKVIVICNQKESSHETSFQEKSVTLNVNAIVNDTLVL